MNTRVSKQRRKSEKPKAAVTSIFNKKERYVYTPRGVFLVPPLPIVLTANFSGRPLTFLEFLSAEESAPFLNLVFGAFSTDAFAVLRDFRKATYFHYFGHRSAKSKKRPPKNPGLLDESNSKTRARLT